MICNIVFGVDAQRFVVPSQSGNEVVIIPEFCFGVFAVKIAYVITNHIVPNGTAMLPFKMFQRFAIEPQTVLAFVEARKGGANERVGGGALHLLFCKLL